MFAPILCLGLFAATRADDSGILGFSSEEKVGANPLNSLELVFFAFDSSALAKTYYQ
jgi:hypothetical protein